MRSRNRIRHFKNIKFEQMKNSSNNNNKIHKAASLTTAFIGFVLLVYMVIFESEPGALPFFLLLFGVVWFVINQKKRHK